MTVLERVRLKEELRAMATPELQLVITDQRELYSDAELRLVLEELENRSDLDPKFKPEDFIPCPQDELPEAPSEMTPQIKPASGSRMAPIVELVTLAVSLIAVLVAAYVTNRTKNIYVLLIAVGAAAVLLVFAFALGEALRTLADLSAREKKRNPREKP